MAGAIDLSIVVPAYNEAGRLAKAIERLDDAVARGAIAPASTEIVFVDDGSTDGTEYLARELLGHFPHLRVLGFEHNRGKGAAVRLGVSRAQGSHIAFTDADMAIDPDQFPYLVAALDRADVAIGSRRLPGATAEGDSARRRFMGQIFNRLVNSLTGLGFGDTQCGFKGFRAPVARLLFHCTVIEGFAFDVEVLYAAKQLGLHIEEVPVSWHNIGGTRIRPLADPLAMATDIVSGWARRRPPSPVPALRVGAPPGQSSAAELAAASVGRSFPVMAEPGGGATVLLPLADPDQLTRATSELRGVVGDAPDALRQVSISFASLRARAPLQLVDMGSDGAALAAESDFLDDPEVDPEVKRSPAPDAPVM